MLDVLANLLGPRFGLTGERLDDVVHWAAQNYGERFQGVRGRETHQALLDMIKGVQEHFDLLEWDANPYTRDRRAVEMAMRKSIDV